MQNHETALAHYGIKGQRWGVRRFQDESGSLTAAGKERYGRGTATGAKHRKQSRFSAIKGKVQDKLRENPKNMTDDELQERINRLRKESEYKRLSEELNRKPGQNQNNQGQGQGKKNKGGGKKHPYLALALLTPVATAIGMGTSAITKEHVSNFLNKRADTKVFTAIEYARKFAGTARAQALREASERAVRTADKVSDLIYK